VAAGTVGERGVGGSLMSWAPSGRRSVSGETDYLLGGTGRRSVQAGGIQTRGRFPRLHEVSQDPEDLGGLGDHGDDLHGAVTAGADQRVSVVNLLDEPGPCGAALLGRDGQLGWRLFGGTDMDGGLGLMVALPSLRSEADQVGLARPPSRRASAPAGPGVPRVREEYSP